MIHMKKKDFFYVFYVLYVIKQTVSSSCLEIMQINSFVAYVAVSWTASSVLRGLKKLLLRRIYSICFQNFKDGRVRVLKKCF